MRVSELTATAEYLTGKTVDLEGYFRGHDDLAYGGLYNTHKDARHATPQTRIVILDASLCRRILEVGGASCRVCGDKTGKAFRASIRLTGRITGRNAEGFLNVAHVTAAELIRSGDRLPLIIPLTPPASPHD